MSIRIRVERNPVAPWSIRSAMLAVQTLLVAAVLHRFTTLQTPVAINLFTVVLAIAVVAILLAIWALVGIWRRGERGAGRATLALLIGLGLLGWPAIYLPKIMSLPEINDVTTDTINPPPFRALASARGMGANPVQYPGTVFADQQIAAFPDLVPLRVVRPVNEAYDLTRSTLERLGIAITAATPPADASGDATGRTVGAGLIEAVDRSLIIGFRDDLAIRVAAIPEGTQIDIRSSSRFGRHDFGRNATRVRSLLKELQGALIVAGPQDDIAEAEREAEKERKRKRAVANESSRNTTSRNTQRNRAANSTSRAKRQTVPNQNKKNRKKVRKFNPFPELPR